MDNYHIRREVWGAIENMGANMVFTNLDIQATLGDRVVPRQVSSALRWLHQNGYIEPREKYRGYYVWGRRVGRAGLKAIRGNGFHE